MAPAHAAIAPEKPLLTEGANLLRRFLDENALLQSPAAVLLGTTPASVHEWLCGKKRPDAAMRRRIARWTNDCVPAAAWETADERADVDSTEPFPPRAATAA